MLPNEEFALACRAYYEEQGLIVDKKNGEFAHCPYPKNMGETGYYLLHEHHQQQGLLQSRDVGQRCFWGGDAKKWLLTTEYFPDNFFELWDIYDEFMGNTSHLHTKEVRVKRGEACRAFQKTIPKKERQERMKKASQSPKFKPGWRGKPVEIIFPDGKIGTYPSARFASLALGTNPGLVYGWINCQGGEVKRQRYKGYRARFL
jgi:hypothetical protein